MVQQLIRKDREIQMDPGPAEAEGRQSLGTFRARRGFRSQKRIDPSPEQPATMSPFRENVAPKKDEGSVTRARGWPLAASHRRSEASEDEETIQAPSGDQATPRT